MIDAEKIRNEFPMLVAGDKDAKPLAFLDSTERPHHRSIRSHPQERGQVHQRQN